MKILKSLREKGQSAKKSLHKLFASLIDFFLKYQTLIVDQELPSKLKKKTLYIVKEDSYLEQAAMLCPCGCKNVLHLNLLTDERPCWVVTTHPDNTSSLHPSVWRKKGCNSHFWFKHGRVIWCKP